MPSPSYGYPFSKKATPLFNYVLFPFSPEREPHLLTKAVLLPRKSNTFTIQ